MSQESVYFQNKLSLNLYISVFGHVSITRLKRMATSKLPRSNLTEIRILLSQLSVYFQNKLSLNLYISVFGHVSITRLKRMARKGLMEGLPENVPELKEPWPIYLLTKATKIPRGPTTDISKFAPEFMHQMDFAFFNVESIRVLTSTSVAVCFATSYPFGFPSRSKRPPLDILKYLVTILIYQDKKVEFIRVDEDGALARSSEFIRTFHNMNIVVQTTGVYASSLNSKSESPNKTFANITRTILLNSSHNKELCCFACQYYIWISRQTETRLCGDVPYFLWYGISTP